jgi:hypothetical protein
VFEANKSFLKLIGGTLLTNQKIILTTDQDLIKDGVQAIDDEFLKWFFKNPSCESVEVESMVNMIQFTPREFIYKIIIPNQEPKQIFCGEADKFYRCVNCDTPCGIEGHFIEEPKPIHEQIIDLCGGEGRFKEIAGLKPKQETLEEAAEIYAEQNAIDSNISYHNLVVPLEYAFRKGAKWQQERSYSEEEVIKLLIYCKTRFGGSGLEDYVYDNEVIEWFEQFKNK